MRYPFIDYLRTLAIILMVIFHTAFDLSSLQLIQLDLRSPFWYFLPRLIVFLFLFSSGISMQIEHQDKIKWDKFTKRLIKLLLAASIVSLVTYILFPANWIYFGTLHCIALSSLLGLIFINRFWQSALLSLILIALPLVFPSTPFWFKLTNSSLDYIPIVPWFSCFLVGLFSYKLGIYRLLANRQPAKWISWCNKHSLLIYLIHQPIIWGSLVVLKKLFYVGI